MKPYALVSLPCARNAHRECRTDSAHCDCICHRSRTRDKWTLIAGMWAIILTLIALALVRACGTAQAAGNWKAAVCGGESSRTDPTECPIEVPPSQGALVTIIVHGVDRTYAHPKFQTDRNTIIDNRRLSIMNARINSDGVTNVTIGFPQVGTQGDE